jgi:hypothetical protein
VKSIELINYGTVLNGNVISKIILEMERNLIENAHVVNVL